MLALSLGLAPIDRALASQPETPVDSQPDAESTTSGFAVAPPAPEPAPEGQALRILPEQPIAEQPITEPITFADPPAPVVEPQPEAPPPTPTIRTVDSRRPRPGTGLIALGALGMGLSASMVIGAMAGPGWADVGQREAAIVGGLSLPVGLIGTTMVITGAQVNRRYTQWADRNAVYPPRTGNGLIVAGASVTIAGLAALGVSTQRAITNVSPDRGDWALVGISGAVATMGMVVLVNGMLTRSKFVAWERAAYLQPGTMALRGGAGLSFSGRF